MPISNSPHIFSPLSVKTLEDLKQSRFEIHLSRVILTQNGTSDPKRYSGAGIIRQTNDGKFELVLFSDEPPDIGSWMESINNKCVKFWDENDFFDLEGVDFDRTKWVAKKLQLSHFPHVPEGGKSRIVSRFEELFVEKDILYKQGKNPEMASITIWIAEHVDSPLNTSPKIVADKFEFSLEFDPVTETTIVKVVFPRELYFDELLNRIFETVQITHFRFLSPILAIIKNGKSKLLQVRGINPDARLISEEQRPVFFYLADESDHVEFFSKFFLYNIQYKGKGRYSFSADLLSQLRTKVGTVDTQALILSVHLERQVKLLFKEKWAADPTYSKKDERLAELFIHEMESLERCVELWEGDNRVKSRIEVLISNEPNKLKNPRVSIDEKFRPLIDKEILTKDQFASWKSLRNHLAHGGMLSELNSGFRSGILHYFEIQVAYYRLMFAVIGFKGKYLDHTSLERQLVVFNIDFKA